MLVSFFGNDTVNPFWVSLCTEAVSKCYRQTPEDGGKSFCVEFQNSQCVIPSFLLPAGAAPITVPRSPLRCHWHCRSCHIPGWCRSGWTQSPSDLEAELISRRALGCQVVVGQFLLSPDPPAAAPKALSAAPGNLGQATASERGDEEKSCHPFLCVK